MGLRIRTNVQSLSAQRQMGLTTQEVAKSSERLSSGNRINRGADDAAGYAIAENLRADVRALAQAKRNTNDGISLIEVAESGLAEINNIVVRLRELTIQAASDTIGSKERGYLNQEFSQLKDEVDRIALSTEFNGTRLLTGNAGNIPEDMLADHNYSPLEIQVGKDYFQLSDSLENPNPTNIIRLDLSKMNAFTEGEDSLNIGNSRNEEGTRIDTKANAQMAMGRLDAAMERVARYRAELGAKQNRLEKTDQSIGVAVEALSSAKSRIKDVDYAAETANMTQQSILQQAGASVLVQANQQPQIALKLLQG